MDGHAASPLLPPRGQATSPQEPGLAGAELAKLLSTYYKAPPRDPDLFPGGHIKQPSAALHEGVLANNSGKGSKGKRGVPTHPSCGLSPKNRTHRAVSRDTDVCSFILWTFLSRDTDHESLHIISAFILPTRKNSPSPRKHSTRPSGRL